MSDARRSRIELEWKAGGSIPMASLGDPTSGDRYELCLYRDGASRELLFGAAPRAAGSCGEQSCWRRKNERFDYADRTGGPDGITRARADARSGIVTMRGAGTTLRLPDLPLSTPAVAEVRVDGGACWRMPLDAATVRRNDEGGVRARQQIARRIALDVQAAQPEGVIA